MAEIYPMHVSYTSRSPIWGGKTLARRFGKTTAGGNNAADATIGETWELSVRQDAMSRILDGIYAGMTLGEYIDLSGGAAVGEGFAPGDNFPLLIKFIDAADRLSVQVHPDDDYAARVEGGNGKTEMWYIIAAEPGAELIMGLRNGIDPAEFRAAAGRGEDVSPLLCRKKVSAGECFFIPSGMIHAIGGGILIAEIQQNCDLTYRVWDWGRVDSSGRPRELHVERACDVVRSFAPDEVEAERFECSRADDVLASCRYFTVRLGRGGDSFTAGADSFNSVLCFEGQGTVEWSGGSVALAAGESIFIPAGLGDYTLRGSARALISRV